MLAPSCAGLSGCSLACALCLLGCRHHLASWSCIWPSPFTRGAVCVHAMMAHTNASRHPLPCSGRLDSTRLFWQVWLSELLHRLRYSSSWLVGMLCAVLAA